MAVLAQGGREPALRQSGRLMLTPQHTLHLVECDGQVLLLATHPRGVSVLDRRARSAAEPARLATERKGAAAG